MTLKCLTVSKIRVNKTTQNCFPRPKCNCSRTSYFGFVNVVGVVVVVFLFFSSNLFTPKREFFFGAVIIKLRCLVSGQLQFNYFLAVLAQSSRSKRWIIVKYLSTMGSQNRGTCFLSMDPFLTLMPNIRQLTYPLFGCIYNNCSPFPSVLG